MGDLLVGKKMMAQLGSRMSERTAPSSETFGQRMLEKMGWSKGKGLGKEEQGMSDHIKVKKREEAVGLGADEPEKMDDQWWHDVYNRAVKVGCSAKSKKKKKKAKRPPTDEELFAACGGARLGMRARGSCNGKLLRADGGIGVKKRVKDKAKAKKEARAKTKAKAKGPDEPSRPRTRSMDAAERSSAKRKRTPDGGAGSDQPSAHRPRTRSMDATEIQGNGKAKKAKNDKKSAAKKSKKEKKKKEKKKEKKK
eukprot:g5233.t1